MSETKKSGTSKSYEGFSAEERAAMKARAKELKSTAKKEELEAEVVAKIAEMPESDRVIAERIHALVKETAPELSAKLWYGMPAYTKDGKNICFFTPGEKFNSRYATFGFEDTANLDEGSMWPTSFAVKKLTKADEARIVELLRRALS